MLFVNRLEIGWLDHCKGEDGCRIMHNDATGENLENDAYKLAVHPNAIGTNSKQMIPTIEDPLANKKVVSSHEIIGFSKVTVDTVWLVKWERINGSLMDDKSIQNRDRINCVERGPNISKNMELQIARKAR